MFFKGWNPPCLAWASPQMKPCLKDTLCQENWEWALCVSLKGPKHPSKDKRLQGPVSWIPCAAEFLLKAPKVGQKSNFGMVGALCSPSNHTEVNTIHKYWQNYFLVPGNATFYGFYCSLLALWQKKMLKESFEARKWASWMDLYGGISSQLCVRKKMCRVGWWMVLLRGSGWRGRSAWPGRSSTLGWAGYRRGNP